MANTVIAEEKQAHIQALEKELEGLFRYYGEAMCEKVCMELSQCGGSRDAVVAALMEESDLPLSRLVDEIHDKLNKEVANGAIVNASVKGSILFMGQRMMYGVPNADADMLEDNSQSCLWCWETRDVKLFPKSVRGQLVVRRTCRRMIHERITAVSEMIASLKKLVSEPNCDHDLIKASAKLSKAYSEADIRSLVDGLLQKNSEDMAKKKANQEDKMLIKQLETNRREAEKEKESLHNELQRETVLSESDSKLLKGEARNEEKCCEKRGQQKKQVEEAEKDQRRQEKEAELKKKHLQKQISIMKRFLKRSKINPSIQNDRVSTKSSASDSSSIKSESVCESATLAMDNTLASSSVVTLEDLHKSHIFPKRFRLNAKNYFLNYPHCSLSKEEALAQLQSLNTPTSKNFIRVCRELHENGEPHLHALIQFEGRYQCTNPRFFDLICPSRSTHFHPNIQVTKSASDVNAYVEKDGELIDFGVFQIDGRSSRGDKQYVQESDSKLLKGEARNDEKCGEKREQQQKQVEEAEKGQRRREKEAELKKKRLQKQVSIMESFVKSKINPSIQNDKVSTKSFASDSSSIKSESVSESAPLTMDNTLASSSDATLEDLHMSHIFPKRFRLNAKNYFLNYPRCSLSKEEALAQLQSLNTPTSKKFIRVCRELHENEEPHLHALIQFEGRYQCTNPRFFDLICPSRSTYFHPNIQATKSASDVKAYVEKDEELIDFGVFQIDGRSSRGDKQYVQVSPFNDDNLSNDYTKEYVIS